MTLYLDTYATTPLDPRVRDELISCFQNVPGNAGSPHEFGRQAKHLLHQARERVTSCLGARRHEVVFTSGATESNNLAILGLAAHGEQTGKRHIVSTQIEHKAVLEPLQVLTQRGFELTLVPPGGNGQVSASDVLNVVRDDTLLVSVMHVNNETGVCQPIRDIADGLKDRPLYFHVDAAQGFGKQNVVLNHSRIDLVSMSAHKIHGPQGIGALIARRRSGTLPPLAPLTYGGGQQFGLRPGTMAVPLIAAFGLAAELAHLEAESRTAHCRSLRETLLDQLRPLNPIVHGDLSISLPNVINLSIPGWGAHELIETLDGIAAISDGAACTSICATSSHVLSAMCVEPAIGDGAIRISWSYLTPMADFQKTLEQAVDQLKRKIH